MDSSIRESAANERRMTAATIQIRKSSRFHALAGASAIFVMIVLLGGFAVPWISPYGSGELRPDNLLEGPSWSHPMGTDALGRDLLTRVLYGARVSMTVGIGTALIALVIGTTYGLVSGFKGGKLDDFMMRIVDIFYGLPDMLIFILLSLLFGKSIVGLLIALGLVTWVRFARITRGQVLQAKEFVYVEGARAMGAPRRRILLRHILPNILGPILVTLTFSIPAAILAESTLSFIGLGINDPYSGWGTSWGTLAQDGWRAMRAYPHIIFFPAAAIVLTILAFNTTQVYRGRGGQRRAMAGGEVPLRNGQPGSARTKARMSRGARRARWLNVPPVARRVVAKVCQERPLVACSSTSLRRPAGAPLTRPVMPPPALSRSEIRGTTRSVIAVVRSAAASVKPNVTVRDGPVAGV